MPFGPVDPKLDLVALEERVLARWQQAGLRHQVHKLRQGEQPWVFYEGPPTANGRPGLHHVWARVFKDLFPRFQTMRGRDVPRKGGWDCHGLPVEIEVEKELGFTSKDQIEQFGIDRFNDRCRQSVQRYVSDWEALTERAGVWIDTDDAYWTLSNDYVESVWWLLAQMYDSGLLYEGHRVVPYCRRCGTALSSHELGQPGAYRDVTDPSVYVRFPLMDDDADLLVWTTTPWTLVSNVAAAVGPDIEYVRVRSAAGGRDLVMAAASAPDDAEVAGRFHGRDLVGRGYRRPFDLLALEGRAEVVVAADFVSTDEGSGIVHLAPAFGTDDMEVARAEGLAVLNPVGPRGTFDDTVGPWAGRVVSDVNRDIIADLSARGLLVAEEPYEHSYPHCWRCGTPLIYWAKTSWFVRTSERRDELVAQNETIDWHPDHIKHGRFGDWLENNVDWALSRDRYWGTPLPIWRCDDGHDTCIGSVAELASLARHDLSDLDLHRPYVDEVVFACPAGGCAAPARRLAPVLDAWFDSGAMPSAQDHFPFEAAPTVGNSSPGDITRPERFPADFICEAIDQTRGWFYSLLAVNTLVFGAAPFRTVVCLGLLVDETGQKMSKSKGNVVDPLDVFSRFGADALRWYFFSAGSPWTSRRIYQDGLRESTRRTLLTLWNVLSFFATYADIDGWQPESGAGNDSSADDGHVMDRWLRQRLDQTVSAVTESLDGFDALAASDALATFVDDLSNWYVRRSRSRFWGDHAPHAVLHQTLVVTAQLLAPFCPFLADEMYVTLTGDASVHLSDWPRVVADGFAQDLGLPMEAVRRLVGLGRTARNDAGIPNRQPLRRALLLHPGTVLSEELLAAVAEELNVKRLEQIGDLSEVMSWTIVPNFRALGPRLGARVNEIKTALAAADGSELRRALDADGFVTVAGERLGPDDLEVRAGQHSELAVVQDGGWAVALDLELDEALRCEGLARQLAREINDLRKREGLALSDRVAVTIDAGPRVASAVEVHGEWLAAQVLAASITQGTAGPAAAHIELDGETTAVALAVQPAA
ncbi:MAG: isoleucine--tRNA ligase [Acidimicrobiales bacterium]